MFRPWAIFNCNTISLKGQNTLLCITLSFFCYISVSVINFLPSVIFFKVQLPYTFLSQSNICEHVLAQQSRALPAIIKLEWEWMRMKSCQCASLLLGSLNRRIESALTDMPHQYLLNCVISLNYNIISICVVPQHSAERHSA